MLAPLLAAERISEYLTFGMHHSTSEAKIEIAKIIEESICEAKRDRYSEFKKNLNSETYAEGMAVHAHNKLNG
jgi:actin-related protein